MMATSKRTLWKGAISFGLVHIPIALHPATTEQALDFDWLDKRSMDPVGYKRINKKTGQEIDKENIVKGIEYADGEYVIVSPEEIEAAYPKTTQTIEIEAFVPVADMSAEWDPQAYHDSFKQQILDLVQKKIKAGQTESVTPIEPQESSGPSATIYDLTELLQRSLNKGGQAAKTPEKSSTPGKPPSVKKTPAKTTVKTPGKKKAA